MNQLEEDLTTFLADLSVSDDEATLVRLTSTAVRRGRLLRRRRRAVTTAAPVLGVTALAVGVAFGGVSDTRGGQRRSAVMTATASGSAAPATSPADTTQSDAPYWYVSFVGEQRNIGSDGAVTTTAVPLTQTWLGDQRAGRSLQAGGASSVDQPYALQVGALTLTWPQLASLPTSAPALDAYLSEHAASGDGDPSLSRWRLVGRLSGQSPASPALRLAALRMETADPAVTVKRGAHDSQGRVADVYTYAYADDTGATSSYDVDPTTGQLLETDEFNGDHTETAGPPADHVPPHTLVSRIVYLAAGPVATDTAIAPPLA